LFVAFLIIAAAIYPSSRVEYISKQPPEVVAQRRQEATIELVVAASLAVASFVFAWRATLKRRSGNNVA
jgi:hypothetical protein